MPLGREKTKGILSLYYKPYSKTAELREPQLDKSLVGLYLFTSVSLS
jgi:hypothetical protein